MCIKPGFLRFWGCTSCNRLLTRHLELLMWWNTEVWQMPNVARTNRRDCWNIHVSLIGKECLVEKVVLISHFQKSKIEHLKKMCFDWFLDQGTKIKVTSRTLSKVNGEKEKIHFFQFFPSWQYSRNSLTEFFLFVYY